MPDLGNRSVLDGGSLINIKRPAAAEDLLERALSRPRRRVIFFCSCELRGGCHRAVARESQKTLALPDAMSMGAAAGTEMVSVLLGPAHFTARGAHLKVLAVQPGVNDPAAFRGKNGYVGMTSNA